MRIAQVVTLVSEDSAFGGPLSVARIQATELARRGHDVTLFAGWDGRVRLSAPGVQVSLHRVRQVLPRQGFSGLIAPGLVAELYRTSSKFDVMHVHLGRDLITLGAASIARHAARTLFVQTHGMVMPDQRHAARVVDRLATRRVLTKANTVFSLSDIETDGLRRVAGARLPIARLGNGVNLRVPTQTRQSGTPKVVFCSRLHPRKRVLNFAAVAKSLLHAGVVAEFVVAGPDEGDLANLRQFIAREQLEGRLNYVGALAPDSVRNLLAEASVYVLPSVNEPFPMTLLEALAEGAPSVITDTCTIAPRLHDRRAVIVTDGSPTSISRAVKQILTDPSLAASLRVNGRQIIEAEFSAQAVGSALENHYRESAG